MPCIITDPSKLSLTELAHVYGQSWACRFGCAGLKTEQLQQEHEGRLQLETIVQQIEPVAKFSAKNSVMRVTSRTKIGSR